MAPAAGRSWSRARTAGVGALALLIMGGSPASSVSASPPPAPPHLYYTVSRPPALKQVAFRISGGQLQIGKPKTVASLAGADGLAIAPDGDLLVGGGSTGMIYKVHPQDGTVAAMPSGLKSAFHVSVSLDGGRAWTAGLPGQLASFPLKPFGPGTPVALQGDNAGVTMIGFAPKATFYTSSDANGTGDFGTIDLTTGVTRRDLVQQRGAHGIVYDTFSQDVLLFGSYSILQIDPAQPAVVVSQKIMANVVLDQGTSDGHGHVLVASNLGDLVLVDYRATGHVGDPKVAVSRVFLDASLDDVVLPPEALAVASSPGGSSSSSTLPVVFGVIGAIAAATLVVFVVRARPWRRRPVLD